jgi:hypothetical protein
MNYNQISMGILYIPNALILWLTDMRIGSNYKLMSVYDFKDFNIGESVNDSKDFNICEIQDTTQKCTFLHLPKLGCCRNVFPLSKKLHDP